MVNIRVGGKGSVPWVCMQGIIHSIWISLYVSHVRRFAEIGNTGQKELWPIESKGFGVQPGKETDIRLLEQTGNPWSIALLKLDRDGQLLSPVLPHVHSFDMVNHLLNLESTPLKVDPAVWAGGFGDVRVHFETLHVEFLGELGKGDVGEGGVADDGSGPCGACLDNVCLRWRVM